eukprot:396776-Rhodomonas_salina.2
MPVQAQYSPRRRSRNAFKALKAGHHRYQLLIKPWSPGPIWYQVVSARNKPSLLEAFLNIFIDTARYSRVPCSRSHRGPDFRVLH